MSTLTIRRGQIWLYNANPTLGDEISKVRPAIIVNSDEIGILRLKIVVPITSWNDAYSNVPWMLRLEPTVANGLSKPSAADTFQVRSVSQQRLIRQLGVLPNEAIQSIGEALAIVLSIH